ncbi:phytohormone-binding protein CSBP-like [Prosopis cineraria]|uniref:phytohormone-binding protein CSBP-like n=1 Tax=Prosopis cineraria TaxID=364024 RepID=UPI00240EE5EA|nr:phytohormone-binding protein CSBP-like [Prosopis cineraria]
MYTKQISKSRTINTTMVKEFNTQTVVSVGLEIFWQALAKDFIVIVPKVLPQHVKDVQVLEGDGGLGTVLNFNFCSDASTGSYQKERISELDWSSYEIGLEVIEGGHLNRGFSFYKTSFLLAAKGPDQTEVNVKISYEAENEDVKSAEPTLFYIRSLENYLLHDS